MLAVVGSRESTCIDTFTHWGEANGLKEQLEDNSDNGTVSYIKTEYGDNNE